MCEQALFASVNTRTNQISGCLHISVPFSLPSHFLKKQQVNLSLRAYILFECVSIFECTFCSTRLQMSWSSLFNEHVYDYRVPAACSCVKCGSADEDDLIRDFGMEVIDISLWDGHIDLVISATSAELVWVGQE